MTNELLAAEIRRVITELVAHPVLKERQGRLCLVPKNLLERLVLYSGALSSNILGVSRAGKDEEKPIYD